MEMVAAIVHQLTRNLTDEEIRANPAVIEAYLGKEESADAEN